MRAVALIAALACASAAHADGSRESRYGPAPERAPTAIDGRGPGYTGATYSGRALGWSGKREVVEPTAQAASQTQPWWARGGAPAPQPQQQAQQPARTTYAPQAPVPPTAPAARALPQSIYDIPPPAPVPPTAPAAPVAYATPAPQQQASLQPGQLGARTYSVGRQFGMTPDPIPAAGPPRMVLIAPPASAPDDEDKAKSRDDGDGEWSAKPEKDGQ